MIPAERVLNVQYADFIRDPLAVARSVYMNFDIPLTPEGEAEMARYMSEHARATRPAHSYDDATLAEWAQRARGTFARYQEYFGVPNEM